MVFEKIDRSSWKRNEYFEHYFTDIPCTYSMTVKLDITQIKKKRMRLYPAMLYYLATIVNRHWSTFESFNLNLQKGYSYLIPIFTLGKYYEEDERILLPLAVQVHHAVCDGFHICRFVNELQELINS